MSFLEGVRYARRFTATLGVTATLGLTVGLLVAACSGNTTSATSVTPTSATLNAEGECDGGLPTPCYWYWQYGSGGQYQFETPLRGPSTATTGGKIPLRGENVTQLQPATTYRYQICGKGDNVPQFVCVGPDGAPKTSTSFTTPYWIEHLDGQFNNTFFGHVAPPVPNPLSWVDGVSGEGARLTLCGVSSPDVCNGGTQTTSGSNYGQLAVIDASCENAHAGAYPSCNPAQGHEEDSWYRFRIRFPTGYQPTPSTQNTVFELHVDDTTEADAHTQGATAYSTAIGVASDGFSSSSCPGNWPATPYHCVQPGTNPRLFIQTPGGSDSTNNPTQRFPLPPNSLLLNHWYDIVLHVYWSANATKGHVQWWVDGAKALDVTTPTLYTRSDGTLSYGEDIGLYNYRLWASWPASVDFDELYVGPTADSVGFSGG